MSALSTSGLSVELLLRVIGVKYGCFTLLNFTRGSTAAVQILGNVSTRLALFVLKQRLAIVEVKSRVFAVSLQF